jgi:hypothetical protein
MDEIIDDNMDNMDQIIDDDMDDMNIMNIENMIISDSDIVDSLEDLKHMDKYNYTQFLESKNIFIPNTVSFEDIINCKSTLVITINNIKKLSTIPHQDDYDKKLYKIIKYHVDKQINYNFNDSKNMKIIRLCCIFSILSLPKSYHSILKKHSFKNVIIKKLFEFIETSNFFNIFITKIFRNDEQLNNLQLRYACESGNLNEVKRLLSTNIDPSCYNNSVFISSCKYGHIDIVKLLLTDDRVDPASENNEGFVIACENNRVDIVNLLLNDSRITPNYLGFIKACTFGHMDTFSLLCSHPRIDITEQINKGVLASLSNGHTEISKILLADVRVRLNPQEYIKAIRTACHEGYKNTVNLLLSTYNIDVKEKNKLVYICSIYGHVDILKILLTDHNIIIGISTLRQAAVVNGDIETLTILVDHIKKKHLKLKNQKSVSGLIKLITDVSYFTCNMDKMVDIVYLIDCLKVDIEKINYCKKIIWAEKKIYANITNADSRKTQLKRLTNRYRDGLRKINNYRQYHLFPSLQLDSDLVNLERLRKDKPILPDDVISEIKKYLI